MIDLHLAAGRGKTAIGWLNSAHTFSFGDFRDPARMGFGALRVLNDDRVAPGGGFPSHPHRDMEIISWVVEGALEHRDSLGTGSVIRPGDLQRMSAGRGIVHSEFNASRHEPVRFLQIWIPPDTLGLDPSYEQRHFDEAERNGRLRLMVSPDGADGSVTIHRDVKIFGASLKPGQRIEYALNPGRYAWIQVVRGHLSLGDLILAEGDGAAIYAEASLSLGGLDDDAELLLFDVP